MSLAVRRVLAVALMFIGSVGLCCGFFPVLIPFALAGDIARVQGLEPISYAAFEDGAPGREVLVEGTLSPRNRLSPEGFIIYTRYLPGVDADGDRTWNEAETVRPPLLIEIPGGLVRVDGAYTTSGSMPTTVEDATLRIEGLRAGDTVIAVGTLVSGREEIELEAEFVGVGTREEFLESNRLASLVLSIFGWTLLGGGLLLFGGGLLLLIRSLAARRASPTPF